MTMLPKEPRTVRSYCTQRDLIDISRRQRDFYGVSSQSAEPDLLTTSRIHGRLIYHVTLTLVLVFLALMATWFL